MKKILSIFILLLSISLISCKNSFKSDGEYVILDDIVYVDNNHKTSTLHKNDFHQIDNIDTYIKNFEIYDSLLFIDTNLDDGLLNIISLDSKKSYGKLFRKGKGPGEFVFGINLNLYTTFSTQKDSLISFFYDSITGHLYETNISDYINRKESSIVESKLSDLIPHAAFWVKVLNDTTVFYRKLDEEQTHQNRKVKSFHKTSENPNIVKLNKFEIPVGEDFNIMSTLVAKSPKEDTFVEAMIGANYLQLYSLKEDKGKTICIGTEMDKLSDIISTSKRDRKYMFADIRAYKFGFGVLKYDIPEYVYQSNQGYTPSILFFDWNGNILKEIKTDIQFNHFDFDERNKELYILDSDNRLSKAKITI